MHGRRGRGAWCGSHWWRSGSGRALSQRGLGFWVGAGRVSKCGAEVYTILWSAANPGLCVTLSLGWVLPFFLFFLASFFPSLESQRETVEDLQLISTSTRMLFANAIRYAHLTRAPGTGVS